MGQELTGKYVSSTYTGLVQHASDNRYYDGAGNLLDITDGSSLEVVLTNYVSNVSLGTDFVWTAGLLDVSILAMDYPYIDGSLAVRDSRIELRVKEASLGSDFYWIAGSLEVSIGSIAGDYVTNASIALANFSKRYVTTFDPTGISTYHVDASAHGVGSSYAVFLYEKFNPVLAATAVDGAGNLDLSWPAGSLADTVKIVLLGGSSEFSTPTSQDSSLFHPLLGSFFLDFRTNELEVDGFLDMRNHVIKNLSSPTDGSDAANRNYVDSSLNTQVNRIDASLLAYATNASVNLTVTTINASIGLMTTNASANLVITTINASVNALRTADLAFATNPSVGTALGPYTTNASVGLVVTTINASIGLMATNSSVGLALAQVYNRIDASLAEVYTRISEVEAYAFAGLVL